MGEPEPGVSGFHGGHGGHDVPAFVFIFGSFAVGVAASWLWRRSFAIAWPRSDAVEAFLWLAIVVWFGGLAVVGTWIVLRATGAVGPLTNGSW